MLSLLPANAAQGRRCALPPENPTVSATQAFCESKRAWRWGTFLASL